MSDVDALDPTPDPGSLPRRWDLTVAEARERQQQMRGRLVTVPPPGFAPRYVAGADVSAERFKHYGYAAVVVIDMETGETVDEASAAMELRFPYVPGYLSFREIPPLDAAWARLRVRPDVVVFDGHGYAHPRRFGLACHGGVVWDVPSVGCAKNPFIGTFEPVADERGATSPIIHEGETIGSVVRTRAGAKPLYVSAGHRMDLPTAVDLVLRLAPRYRQPETTRRAHHLVNELRRADKTES
ncbi:deoxyribonuclease V [Longimicrobium sp.]|uniref:deoxyribonuclease V n=1 Tax=Longimicrobium sp. TaxID=2029185 RepID=UPI002E2F07ED|nr:deoxyribonuclease V [Longimicrobium sp.]HEX6040065.1 deoxyribonuclease V [Longimicrobium sp.]